jgi:hypothetical protein
MSGRWRATLRHVKGRSGLGGSAGPQRIVTTTTAETVCSLARQRPLSTIASGSTGEPPTPTKLGHARPRSLLVNTVDTEPGYDSASDIS